MRLLFWLFVDRPKRLDACGQWPDLLADDCVGCCAFVLAFSRFVAMWPCKRQLDGDLCSRSAWAGARRPGRAGIMEFGAAVCGGCGVVLVANSCTRAAIPELGFALRHCRKSAIGVCGAVGYVPVCIVVASSTRGSWQYRY
jgi:hypothetical protein